MNRPKLPEVDAIDVDPVNRRALPGSAAGEEMGGYDRHQQGEQAYLEVH
jgi:hypothetical protein